jgi:deazaflavin-dependent oxidoreductase (nitroreductase family)
MSDKKPRVPPRWFIRAAWAAHRAIYAVSGGRVGLRTARPEDAGMMRLTTIGRRSGEERKAILSYLVDGPNLVTVAMNGWADPEPAWFLNLQAHPDARVDLPDGHRDVRGRVATADERSRLWTTMHFMGRGLEPYAALRSRETALVILEPRPPER